MQESLNYSAVSTEAAIVDPAEIAAYRTEYGGEIPVIVSAQMQVPESYVPEGRLDAPAAAVGNMISMGAPMQSTLNLNQASCMVERPTLTGREFTNVCTGHTHYLPYTAVEFGVGLVAVAIFALVLAQILSGFGRRNRMSF